MWHEVFVDEYNLDRPSCFRRKIGDVVSHLFFNGVDADDTDGNLPQPVAVRPGFVHRQTGQQLIGQLHRIDEVIDLERT